MIAEIPAETKAREFRTFALSKISQHKPVYREQSANRRHYFRIACHTPSSFLWNNAGRILACAIISIDAHYLLHGSFAIGKSL